MFSFPNFFVFYYGDYFCPVCWCWSFFLGFVFSWTYWWSGYPEPTDLQREEVCGHQQGRFRTWSVGPIVFQQLITSACPICIWKLFHYIEIWCIRLVIFLIILTKMFIISGDEDEVKDRETKQEYTLLCDWIKQQLGDKVAKVQVSKRLSSSPCVLVSGKFGWSANMER